MSVTVNKISRHCNCKQVYYQGKLDVELSSANKIDDLTRLAMTNVSANIRPHTDGDHVVIRIGPRGPHGSTAVVDRVPNNWTIRKLLETVTCSDTIEILIKVDGDENNVDATLDTVVVENIRLKVQNSDMLSYIDGRLAMIREMGQDIGHHIFVNELMAWKLDSCEKACEHFKTCYAEYKKACRFFVKLPQKHSHPNMHTLQIFPTERYRGWIFNPFAHWRSADPPDLENLVRDRHNQNRE